MYKMMQQIKEIYESRRGKSPVFSFEFFPPKNEAGERLLYQTVEELKRLNPAFVSVTYGAGGSTRDRTLEWVRAIQQDHGVTAMAHFTCIGSDRQGIRQSLDEFAAHGIRNIMALRGDRPRDQADYEPPADGFAYANELIAFMRSLDHDFSIGAACYPETHQEAASPEEDLRNLKRKVDAGADFLVTQLFFENRVYFDFVERCREAGIGVPIVPGIMPITAFSQIRRFTEMAACQIPQELSDALEESKEEPERFLRLSREHTIRQCKELLDRGAPGIHFYTLNKSEVTRQVLAALERDGIGASPASE